MKKYNVAILGATGAVGQEFLTLIEERNFPFNELRLLASKRSAGKVINLHTAGAAERGQESAVRPRGVQAFRHQCAGLRTAEGLRHGISRRDSGGEPAEEGAARDRRQRRFRREDGRGKFKGQTPKGPLREVGSITLFEVKRTCQAHP